MAVIELGFILNGVTGRMGANQQLGRSIAAIRDQGGWSASGELESAGSEIEEDQ